jgi:hypothetical protein
MFAQGNRFSDDNFHKCTEFPFRESKLKKALLTLVIAAVLTTAATAQLSRTLDQCQKEYEQPGTVETDPVDGKTFYVFRIIVEDTRLNGSWAIRCWFDGSNVCDTIRYEKLGDNLTGADLGLILLLNSCGYTWNTNRVDKIGDQEGVTSTSEPTQGPYAFLGKNKILIKRR